MPNYAQPFGMAGGLAGGAAGAAGGGVLGQMLGGLNMPRNALWGMPGRLAQGDWKGALPGLAGIAAGGLTAATGAGLPFAGLVGSAVGGLGEGIEESLRPDMQKAPEASDLVKQLGGDPDSMAGGAASMALGMAGDPLTYAGGLGGEGAGKAAGEAGGRYLEGEALARGPGYPGGPQKLLDMIGQGPAEPGSPFAKVLTSMANDPNAERLASQIRPGSYPLGEGVEGKVFGHPDSAGVVRVGGGPPEAGQYNTLQKFHDIPLTEGGAPQPRVVDPAMLPSAHSQAIGQWRMEHNPRVQMLGPNNPLTGEVERSERPLYDLLTGAEGPLTADVASRGLEAADMHARNMGLTPAGRVAITDLGSIVPNVNSLPPEMVGQPRGGWLTNFLLDRLGANKSVQSEIEEKLAQGGGSAGLSREQIANYHGAADANLPPTNPGGGPFIGPNAGLPTGPPESQASELMKALGLSPGGGSPTGGRLLHRPNGVPGWDTGMR